jgi:ankyrin repeat protein
MTLRHSARSLLLLSLLVFTASPVLARSSTEPPVPSRGKLGQELFLAVNHGDLAGVRSLLKRGADPNARNGLEFTPLYMAAASGQMEVMESLLRAGAKLEASSPYGSALNFAALTGNVPSLKFLLARGANVHSVRADGITVLMLAARAGDPEVVGELLRRKAEVNAKDNDGATPLTYAAREGHEAVARLLLAAGAAVDAADSRRWTPLMYAAVNGHPGLVRLMLEKGANVNAREVRGRTPLLLVATYGDHPEVIRALLDGGADSRALDAGRRAALAVATARGHTECARLLGETAAAPSPAEGVTPRPPAQAVQVSLKALQRSMLEFNRRTGCLSCHQDGLGRMTTGAARDRGLALDPAVERAERERINFAVNAMRPLHQAALKSPEAMKNVPLIEIEEVSTIDTWLFAGMAAHRQPPTEGTGAMAMVLARQQAPDGYWRFTLRRVPMQSSFFTTTALAIRSLQVYAPRANAAEVADRIGRAKQWLLTAPAEKSEDRAFRLLGLKWAQRGTSAGGSLAERQKAIEELRAEQRPDGGWPQLPSMPSDAYATGQALYALHVAGALPVTDPVYQQGVQFLLRTQDSDGSWFVNKRAIPANNYFDAAFPHGESQYSSFNGTCWATLALLQTLDRKQPGSQRAAR